MIERLQRALEHIDALAPETQEELAQQIEELTSFAEEEPPEAQQGAGDQHIPARIRRALAAIGSARDLQYDDEFEALDRIRHIDTPHG